MISGESINFLHDLDHSAAGIRISSVVEQWLPHGNAV